jgi:hypothetical protein
MHDGAMARATTSNATTGRTKQLAVITHSSSWYYNTKYEGFTRSTRLTSGLLFDDH